MYNQLATYDEARDIANQLGTLGGGVVDTYIPEYQGPFSPPEDGAAKFLHFRFANGADGFNVGLIRAFMQYSPLRWPLLIGTEIEAARKVDPAKVPAGQATAPATPAVPAYMPIDLSREVRPGMGVYASTAEDVEPLGSTFTVDGRKFVKYNFPNGMMSFRAWQLLA